ncbi:UNVERIFIED_CONTAM: Ankyrin repeat and SAM domain-containing protein 3, partial [Gekko kuhli]
QVPPEGYVTFSDEGSGPEGGDLRYRDVTSPINEHDVESSSSREEYSSFTNNLATVRMTTSSSSESLSRAAGIGSEGSVESNEDSDHAAKLSQRKHAKGYARAKNHDSAGCGSHRSRGLSQHGVAPKPEAPSYAGPQDLASFLEQIGCLKYLQVFEEQDVDLRIFLTLTESDLKEIGITLFGPKRKMTSAIARWHSNARPPSDALELAYADRLEAEMQELAIQLHKRCEDAEALKGQVSQEQELRAVAEGCLMEREVAWSEAQAKLREARAAARNAGVLLEQMRACQTELSSRLAREHTAGRPSEVKAPRGAGPAEGPPTLKALSLPELSTLLEEESPSFRQPKPREASKSAEGQSTPETALAAEEGVLTSGDCSTRKLCLPESERESHLAVHPESRRYPSKGEAGRPWHRRDARSAGRSRDGMKSRREAGRPVSVPFRSQKL